MIEEAGLMAEQTAIKGSLRPAPLGRAFHQAPSSSSTYRLEVPHSLPPRSLLLWRLYIEKKGDEI